MAAAKYCLLCFAIFSGAYAAWFFFAAGGEDQMRMGAAGFIRTVELLEAEAEAGDSSAYRQLGDLYQTTAIAPGRNKQKALGFFRKGAKSGDPEAQYQLGRAHAMGVLVRQDYAKASKWYRTAALLGGHAEANFALGELYFAGRGVLNDHAEAFRFYGRAADRGHPVAQFLVGLMFKEGFGVRSNRVEALKWMRLAADHDADVVAHNPSYNPKRTRRKLEQTLSATQRNEAARLAASFKPKR